MHVHLPKPLHGWREFLGEVGIIVLGVLIALGAEQLVEEWSWHRKAQAAEAAIRGELALDAGVFDERSILASCLEPKEQQLSDIFQRARRTHTLPEIEHISSPADRPLETAVWEAATADGTVSHFPEEFRNTVAQLYQLIIDYRRMSADENQFWSAVRLAEKAPGAVSEPLVSEMLVSLAKARQETRSNDLAAEQSLEVLRGLGVKPNYAMVLGDGQSRADLLKADKCKQLVVNGKPLPPG